MPISHALEHHVGVCVLLCQRIEHTLALILICKGSSEPADTRELVEGFAGAHSAPLERLKERLRKYGVLDDMLPDYEAVVFRRNEIVHRMIFAKPPAMSEDIALFENFQKRCDAILDGLLAGVSTDGLPDAFGPALAQAISEEINRKKAQPAARANGAQPS